ncbi:uncharacterized protein METZ01_LOCUS152662, partial [marine metagenome]
MPAISATIVLNFLTETTSRCTPVTEARSGRLASIHNPIFRCCSPVIQTPLFTTTTRMAVLLFRHLFKLIQTCLCRSGSTNTRVPRATLANELSHLGSRSRRIDISKPPSYHQVAQFKRSQAFFGPDQHIQNTVRRSLHLSKRRCRWNHSCQVPRISDPQLLFIGQTVPSSLTLDFQILRLAS